MFLNENDFRGSEQSGRLRVTMTKTGTNDDPIPVTVTPMTFEQYALLPDQPCGAIDDLGYNHAEGGSCIHDLRGV